MHSLRGVVGLSDGWIFRFAEVTLNAIANMHNVPKLPYERWEYGMGSMTNGTDVGASEPSFGASGLMVSVRVFCGEIHIAPHSLQVMNDTGPISTAVRSSKYFPTSLLELYRRQAFPPFSAI